VTKLMTKKVEKNLKLLIKINDLILDVSMTIIILVLCHFNLGETEEANKCIENCSQDLNEQNAGKNNRYFDIA